MQNEEEGYLPIKRWLCEPSAELSQSWDFGWSGKEASFSTVLPRLVGVWRTGGHLCHLMRNVTKDGANQEKADLKDGRAHPHNVI